jgi:hypothetical protein
MVDESITAEFRLDTDTKNTRRFEEITEVDQSGETMEVPAEGIGQHSIGTLYVQQTALEDAFGELPERIQIEITAPGNE